MLARRSLAFVLSFALLVMASCAVKTPVVAPPTLPKTALQWTIIYNAALAKTNRAVERAIETAQASNSITSSMARPVIIACGKVALASEGVRAITSNGTEASWAVDGPKIRSILTAAQLQLPVSANQSVDLAIAAANAAITLLIQGVI